MFSYEKKLELPVSRKLPIPARAGRCYGDGVFGNEQQIGELAMVWSAWVLNNKRRRPFRIRFSGVRVRAAKCRG